MLETAQQRKPKTSKLGWVNASTVRCKSPGEEQRKRNQRWNLLEQKHNPAGDVSTEEERWFNPHTSHLWYVVLSGFMDLGSIQL